MSTTTKPVNQKAWLLILPVLLCVAFSAILPLMTVVNYSVQDIISPCLLYTSPSPRDRQKSRMPSSA